VRTELLPSLEGVDEPLDIVITVYDGGIKDEAPERLEREFRKLVEKIE
jgi:hypothetical protein